MLKDFFPRAHRRYESLPLLGGELNCFADWLSNNGYHRHLICQHLRTTRRLDRELRSRGCHCLAEIQQSHLRTCAPMNSQEDILLAATVRLWERYLDQLGLLPKPGLTRSEELVAEYCAFLKQVRGLSASTLNQHASTASQLLAHLRYEATPSLLSDLDRGDIELFVRARGGRVSRASLQHEAAHLRSFLRFLANQGEVRLGLDNEIDTPRLYRGEQLPRSLSWDTVCALLSSIDRTTPMGLRDYAMLLLVVTYGLRASEVVALKLDDLEWRAGRIRIATRKARTSLLLPLTDAVGQSLMTYLKRGRPQLPYREVFLRCRAPAGLLKPTAVTDVFQAWSRRSGLNIPFQGVHCLRQHAESPIMPSPHLELAVGGARVAI